MSNPFLLDGNDPRRDYGCTVSRFTLHLSVAFGPVPYYNQTREMIDVLISTKGRYATRMLLDIATHQGNDYVPMKDVAARQQISKKYLETFTARLASAGILGIRHGKNGGYRLLRPACEITLADILSLTEGPLHAVQCLESTPNRCKRCDFCMSLPAWSGLERVVQEYLSSVTLQALIDQSIPQPENIQDYPCGV